MRVGAGHKYGISNLVRVPVWRWLLLEDPRLRRYGFISRLSVVSVIWRDWCRFFFPFIFIVAWLACGFTITIRMALTTERQCLGAALTERLYFWQRSVLKTFWFSSLVEVMSFTCSKHKIASDALKLSNYDAPFSHGSYLPSKVTSA